jgi:hypothetical protein
MLYRVHRPHNQDGSLGLSIGHVHLCHGHITIHHICKVLAEAKIIPERWFLASQLNMAPASSQFRGVSCYIIARKAPHKNHLFYLCPIESAGSENAQKDKFLYSFTSSGDLTLNYTIPNILYNVALPQAALNPPLRVARNVPLVMGADQPVAPPPPPVERVDPNEVYRVLQEVQERMRRQMDEHIFGAPDLPDPNDI